VGRAIGVGVAGARAGAARFVLPIWKVFRGVLMGKLFVERRPEEGDYAIRRPGAERISGHESTQAEAIERAREIDPNAAVLVERVRYTDRGHPDKWRRP
jgi:Uncharacterized protein conserved in bacteria (DUF2188)